MRLAPIALIALIACAGCAPTTAEQPAAPPATTEPESGAQCDANPVQAFLGKPGDAATVARIKAGSGADDVRRYESGSMLTQDFRVDRVNIEVDPAGKIVKINCG